jgi:prepilin-type N-terminal cleavage/methylation domain-containing protein
LTGFTLIELSVVLVIIGLIIFAGIAAWSTIVEGQRIAATRATMENIKRCLITRVMYSEAFPTWQLTNMNCAAPRSQFDVDHCLCGRTDAWGNALRYISGLEAANLGLGENGSLHYIVTNLPQGRSSVTTPHGNSRVRVSAAQEIAGVAFVLISYGSDRVADHASYGGLFAPDLSAASQPANRIGATIPDFSNAGNDLYLVVTSFELAAQLRR